MSADQVNWLLVGPGDISKKRVAPALASATASKLQSVVYRSNRDNAKEIADKFGADDITANYQEALSNDAISAVYIATPVDTHVPLAIQALEAGKHVLIEKPLALNTEDANKLLAAAEKAGKNVSCAYYRRFYPRYEALKQMVDSGELGEIVSARTTYFAYFNPEPQAANYWRVTAEKSGGGVLADMGCHMFDLVVGLFGQPKSAFAKCENLTTSWDVEDSASAILTLPNNAQLTCSFNWNSKTWRHEFEVVGSEAKVCWLPVDAGKIVVTRGRDIQEVDLPNAENVHEPMVQDFCNAILENRAPKYDVAESAKTTRVLDAVFASARENREMEIV